MKVKKLYVIIPAAAVLTFAVYYNWQLAPNPWIVDDLTVGKENQCSVHHVAMVKTKVKIVYGFGAPYHWVQAHAHSESEIEQFIKAEKPQFPNSRTEIGGGCCIWYDATT